MSDSKKTNQIIQFLCSESGSHDYTINRREAAELGLAVEKCSEHLYDLLRQLRNSYSVDMELHTRMTLIFLRILVRAFLTDIHGH